MGGSLAMRLKRDGVVRRVVGLVRRAETAFAAERLGAVDRAATDPARALPNADIVIFATPVRVLMAQLREYAPLFKAGAIVTELGSTKRAIAESLSRLPPRVHPIGSHPMCGKETSGLAAAEATLYEGATWVVSPLPRTPDGVIAVMESLARAVGAHPLTLAPARHDRLVAAISHVPYLLSAALVLAAQSVAEEDETVWRVAASGFRDTSRLAASNVAMMMDILLTNPDAVAEMLGRLRRQLDALSEAIAAGDETRLQILLERAAGQRRRLYPPAIDD